MSEPPETGGAGSRAADEADPRLGMLLDERYRLLRRLGAGGFGAVYEAEHVGIRRKVAVKVLHAHVAADAEMVARFKREAIAATATGHPHIVEVMDLGRTPDGGAYMVLELLRGSDWGAQLEGGVPEPVGRTVRIVRQVLDGLAAAHDKGIVHRDLKAENVFLVTENGERDFVKIVDFGISKMRGEGPLTDAGVTRTGMALGTPAAMAPEQFQGKKDVDARADLWAVGVMLYRALAGRWPFDGETYAMLALDVMTGEPRPLHEVRPEVPEALSALVKRLLSKDREERPRSAREVADALAPFEGPVVDALGATQAGPTVPMAIASPPAATPALPTPPAERSPPWPWIAGAVVLVAIGAGSAFLWAGGTSTETGASRAAVPDASTSVLPTSDADATPRDAATVGGPGRLLVLTTPSGCLVSESGETLGISPLDVELAAGAHALAIECPTEGLVGSTDVVVESGHTARAVVRLEPDAGAPVGRRDRAPHASEAPHAPPATESSEPTPPPPPPSTTTAPPPPPSSGPPPTSGHVFLRPGGI